MAVINTAQNPQHVSIDEIRRDSWKELLGRVFRGARRADIREGDRVRPQHQGSLWRSCTSTGATWHKDEDLLGDEVMKPNAMYLRPPMHRFDIPVDLRRNTTTFGPRHGASPTGHAQCETGRL